MIELFDITQHYSVRPVLKRINLRIEQGELVVVVGPNGMGKSTHGQTEEEPVGPVQLKFVVPPLGGTLETA